MRKEDRKPWITLLGVGNIYLVCIKFNLGISVEDENAFRIHRESVLLT